MAARFSTPGFRFDISRQLATTPPSPFFLRKRKKEREGKGIERIFEKERGRLIISKHEKLRSGKVEVNRDGGTIKIE